MKEESEEVLKMIHSRNWFLNFAPSYSHVPPPTGHKGGALNSPVDFLYLIGVILILVIFMVAMVCLISIWSRRMEIRTGKDAPRARKLLTPTQ